MNVVALSPDQDVATAELGRFLVLFERLVSETELWMANTPPEKLDWVPIDTPQVRFGDRLTKVTIKSLYVHMAVAEHKWSHDLSVCGDGETLQLPRDPKLAERATQGDFMANAREMHRQDMDILSALPEDQLAKRMTFAGDDSQWTVMGFLWGMWGHRAYHLGNLDIYLRQSDSETPDFFSFNPKHMA